MRIAFRTKLGLIVGIATIALALGAVGSALIGIQQTQDLANVERRLVPKLEFGPRLESEFDKLRQSMQDAAAAQDSDALDIALTLKNRLLERIAAAGGTLDSVEAASLSVAIQRYYESGRDISRRLIAGETGEALVEDMAKLQAAHQEASALIKQAARLDRKELTAGFAAVRKASQNADQFRLAISLAGLALVTGLSFWVSRGVLRMVNHLSGGFSRFATGDFNQEIPIVVQDELGDVAREANQMAGSLRRLSEQRDRNDWLRAGLAGLSDELRGELEPQAVAERALWFLARRIEAQAGALYLSDENGILHLFSHYALLPPDPAGPLQGSRQKPFASFGMGQGLLGQAALSPELWVVEDPPQDYLKVRSGLGEASPRALVFLPLFYLGKAVGVAELALFKPCSEQARELLTSVRETLAIALQAAKSRAALRVLLEQTQRQAERLIAQEEELRQGNQELQAQQEELKSANQELETQRYTLSQQNQGLEEASRRVEQKVEELAKVSSYKSQFLANMSHELRTPLNSMLLLSHLLAENESQNLSAKQVDYSRTIHGAGEDLLALINQVLDLAKIEAGKQEVQVESVDLADFAEYARRVFAPLAAQKGLHLKIEIASPMPDAIRTDRQRVERILTNLLGNAIKFTEQGEVALRIGRPGPGMHPKRSELEPDTTVAFAVSDTGIGIAAGSEARVFVPFEQLESRADRRYGGTGLGLAIAQESALLLGGEVELESALGRGSTFTLYLPERAPIRGRVERDRPSSPMRVLHGSSDREVLDDRATLRANEPRLLVIEDDPVLAEQLVEIIHERRFKVLVAKTGQEGLDLAREYHPQGIILDVRLPDIDGWTVMERLVRDPVSRSIPVHFVSATDTPERGLSLGAVGYLTKPATRSELVGVVRTLTRPRDGGSGRILVVEDSADQAESIVALLRQENLDSYHVASAGAALTALQSERFALVILDLGLPDMDGLGLLETLRTQVTNDPPRVVVYTGRTLTKEETRKLETYAEAVIMKEGSSAERLLDEIRLFVRHLKEDLPREGQTGPVSGRAAVSLEGRKILVADDDMRTVYALSAVLRGKGAEVLVADTGGEALDTLAVHPDVQGVLMDIMMPEMDGYEAMRRLRKDPRFEKLPVIALTAKAMKGERERCIEAGASEYLTKPVDSERLLATLQTWLELSDSNGPGRRN